MLKQYEKYKDTNIPWIGKIPEHWVMSVVKRVALFNPKRTRNILKSEFVGYVPMERVKHGFMRPDKILFSNVTSGLTYFEEGDIVMAKVTPCFENGNIAIARELQNQCAFGSSELFVFRAKKINREYLFYLLQNKSIKDVCVSTMTGTGGLKRISPIFVKNMNIPVPPLSEQKTIVSYLDSKVSKIDEYIAASEKKIAALDELKQTIIADVVTHGINSNVKMKNSGIRWIGEIPKHWDITKIRSHFKERRVKVSDKEYQPLSVAKIGVVPQLEDACKTDNGDNRKQVLEGDFVVNSRSDRKGSCGISPLEGSVSLINIVLEPRNIYPKYVHYLFRSNNYIEEFYRNGRGIVADLWTTRYSEMKNISIPYPPIYEQQAIVSYIEKKVTEIDRLKEAERLQIEKLKEYKQRLISDVVTGKVKVTNH